MFHLSLFTICNLIQFFFDRAQEANIYEINIVGTEKVDIVNLDDLLRVVFIDEECGNHRVVIDGGEVTRSINH